MEQAAAHQASDSISSIGVSSSSSLHGSGSVRDSGSSGPSAGEASDEVREQAAQPCPMPSHPARRLLGSAVHVTLAEPHRCWWEQMLLQPHS